MSFTYPQREKPILSRASLRLGADERLGILGDNGSGKSTLLHLAAGLLKPSSGGILHQGRICRTEKDFAEARRRLGYLLQQSDDMLFCPTVLEDVAFGPYNQGKSAAESESLAKNTLDSLGLAHLAARNGNSLSGGERKLAALACILVTQPQILFLDEPTNDLDPKARQRLLAILTDRSLPALIISHDQDFLRRLCTRFCVLKNGAINAVSL
ncbi:MAG: energy-coupling factor ABC transporter ATP-binding protein [Desulfovibrio sp.]|nr:energy-coupling factor ABC transporter ATP-binding protein [Desulfovibrio sp.]